MLFISFATNVCWISCVNVDDQLFTIMYMHQIAVYQKVCSTVVVKAVANGLMLMGCWTL